MAATRTHFGALYKTANSNADRAWANGLGCVRSGFEFSSNIERQIKWTHCNHGLQLCFLDAEMSSWSMWIGNMHAKGKLLKCMYNYLCSDHNNDTYSLKFKFRF